MALSSTDRKIQYIANGTVGPYSFPYYYIDDDHIKVLVTDLDTGIETEPVIGTDYAMDSIGPAPSGSNLNFVLGHQPAAGLQVTIYRDTSLDQEIDYVPNDSFPAETHELGLDKLTMLIQEVVESILRSAKLPISTTFDGELLLPDISLDVNHGRFIRVKADGSGFETVEVDAAEVFSVLTTKGDLAVFSTQADRLPVGPDSPLSVIVADSAQTKGVKFAPKYDEVTTKGDLLVATAADVMTRKGVVTNGQVLGADSNDSTGLKYINVAGESFHGDVRSHPDNDSANSKIRADLSVATMNDGHVYTPGQGLIFDKTVTGTIGGMQAAAVNSTWNKLYYARKRSDGSEGLWGLRAKNFLNDTSFTTASDAVRNLRILTSTPTDRLAQGVTFATAGFLEFVDVYLIRSGAVGGNVWFELWDDSAGNPGTLRATSDKYDASKFATSETIIRFPFRSPFSVSASTQYHLVMQGDYSRSDTIFIGWRGVAAGGYTGGSAKQFDGSTWSAATGVGDFNFKAYIRQNDTALSLPSGYDQYTQIGWFYIDSAGNIKKFQALDRNVQTLTTGNGVNSWYVADVTSVPLLLTDMSAFIPPVPVRIIGGVRSSTSCRFRFGGLASMPGATDESTLATMEPGTANRFIISSSGDDAAAEIGPVHTKYQTVVVGTSGGTPQFVVKGFTW